MGASNWTLVTEFIILGFPYARETELILFAVFLLMYALTFTENIVIILVIGMDYRLHTPMYFFISNLSVLEIGYTTVTVPKMLANIAIQSRTISITGCFTQLYIFFFLGSAECFLLAAMAYDRYLAICNPLHYTTMMDRRVCVRLALGSWLGGFLAPAVPTAFIFRLPFCGSNVINHFFCDSPPLLELSCRDIFEIEVINFMVGTAVLLSSFVLTMVSYIFIVATILRIPTAEGRSKAFSTCASHLTIVTMFYGTTIFMYIRTKTIQAFDFNKVVSIFYSVLTPVINPIIYSLRNNDIKQAMRKVLLRKKDFLSK
ncbi:olfactory receptor 6N1 [Alligator mississippiensis]|uniref:Olfactory receptor n=1 Tax=Alligator mississippiensis TaxID=8496 RepID=A0A151NH23_ALLMI|nr:olfactory receptor 6N1 [Alligator mississippiensis]KYO36121.1 olfactory receptor 6Q1 [Alligator mississippiensis]